MPCRSYAIRTIYDLQLGQYSGEEGVNPPSRIVVFIDELNKYASKDAPKNSPILKQVLDVTEGFLHEPRFYRKTLE